MSTVATKAITPIINLELKTLFLTLLNKQLMDPEARKNNLATHLFDRPLNDLTLLTDKPGLTTGQLNILEACMNKATIEAVSSCQKVNHAEFGGALRHLRAKLPELMTSIFTDYLKVSYDRLKAPFRIFDELSHLIALKQATIQPPGFLDKYHDELSTAATVTASLTLMAGLALFTKMVWDFLHPTEGPSHGGGGGPRK